MRHRFRLVALSAGMMIGASHVASAQRIHLLVVNGLSGEPRFRAPFAQAARLLADSARTRWGVADSSVIVLADDSVGLARVRRSTRAEIADSFVRLSRRVAPGDVVLVFLNGHGSGEGAGSRVSLRGPDATAADFALWLAGFARQTVVFVNAASGSGDFVGVLAGPGRVVVTATRTAVERNETTFAIPFARGLTASAGDTDKDGRVSVLEAFTYARKEVARAYDTDNRMLTEHAVLSDSALARATSFGGSPASADPRVVALMAERRALESQVAALRTRKGTVDAAVYDRELERLLVEIAERTKAIRAAGGRP